MVVDVMKFNGNKQILSFFKTKGNFGEVYRGKYKPKGMVVAVKTCRDTLSEDQRKKFLQEGRILKQYDHPNIVKFIGIAAQRQPVMIVMEYVEGKKRESLLLACLFQWALILVCDIFFHFGKILNFDNM